MGSSLSSAQSTDSPRHLPTCLCLLGHHTHIDVFSVVLLSHQIPLWPWWCVQLLSGIRGSLPALLPWQEPGVGVSGISFAPASLPVSHSQPPASPSTQEAIQGMLSMANLQASESCLQASWGTNQAKNNSFSTQNSKKTVGGGNKNAGKRLLKKSTKNSIDVEDYDEDQDHLDACFKDSDYGEQREAGWGCAWPCRDTCAWWQMSLCSWVPPPAVPPQDQLEQPQNRDLHTRASRGRAQQPGCRAQGHTGFEVHLRCGTMRNFQETWKAPETAAGDCPRNVGQVLLLVTEMFLSAQ